MELRRKENWGDMEKGKKGFKIISLFLVFSIMIVSGAYALEFDNVKEVSTAKNALGYPTVMIKNTWGLGKDLMKIELVENTAHCSECSAVVKLDVYDDYKLPEETSKTFDLVFTNVKTDTTKALSHKFEIASGNRTGNKLGKCENKKIDCPKDTKNETEIKEGCYERVCSNENISEPDYKEFKWEGTTLTPGTYYLRLSAIKKPKDKLDWVYSFMGLKIDELALWDEVIPTTVYEFNDIDGRDSMGGLNLTKVNTPTKVATSILGNGTYFDDAGDSWTHTEDNRYELINTHWTYVIWINISSYRSGKPWIMRNVNTYYTMISTDETHTQFRQYGSGGQIEPGSILNIAEVMPLGEWTMVWVRANGTDVEMGWSAANDTTFSTDVLGVGYGITSNDDSMPFNIGGNSETLDATITQFVWDNDTTWSNEQLTEMFNNGQGLTYGESPPVVSGFNSTLNEPADNLYTNTNSLTFNCSAASVVDGLTNITLVIWNSTNSIVVTNATTVMGSYGNALWVQNTGSGSMAEGTYNWNCLAGNDLPNTTYSLLNRTFTLDRTAPAINITSPIQKPYQTIGGIANVTLNYTYSDATSPISTCWYTFNENNDSTKHYLTDCGNTTLVGNTYSVGTDYNLIDLNINDSAGNSRSATRMFGVIDIGTPQVIGSAEESSTNPFNITLTYDYCYPGVDPDVYPIVKLTYNNTIYTTYTLAQNCSAKIFTYNITTPSHNGLQYSYWYNISIPKYTTLGGMYSYTSAEANFSTTNYTQFSLPVQGIFVFSENESGRVDYQGYSESFTNLASLSINLTDKPTGYVGVVWNGETQLYKFYNNYTRFSVNLTADTMDLTQKVKVAESGGNIVGARVTFKKSVNGSWVTSYQDYTDAYGVASIRVNDGNDYLMSVSKNGYTTYEEIYYVTAGNTDTKSITLTKIGSSEDGTVFTSTCPSEISMTGMTEQCTLNLSTIIQKRLTLQYSLNGTWQTNITDTGNTLGVIISNLTDNYPVLVRAWEENRIVQIFTINRTYQPMTNRTFQIMWDTTAIKSNEDYLALFYILVIILGLVFAGVVETRAQEWGLWVMVGWFFLIGLIGFPLMLIPGTALALVKITMEMREQLKKGD